VSNSITVCALYKFVNLPDYVDLQVPLLSFAQSRDIKGTILLAGEGINGTVAGLAADVDALIDYLERDERFHGIDFKFSTTDERPFYRMKVKLKAEIVSMGVPGVNPNQAVGTYVEPQDWNALIDDPDVLLIDTRNDYEVEIGSFESAVNPSTTTFRQFPNYVAEHCEPTVHKKVAMFCTGGIRCEKASSYMLGQGYEEVYHLKGGILNYLEQVDEDESRWQGECFVFDNRVAVDHKLQDGQYDQCHACRRPITDADKQSPHYEEGVSCDRCYTSSTVERKQRFAERQKQIQLAKRRNEPHIGAPPPSRQGQNPVK